jgi:hypothetical protein
MFHQSIHRVRDHNVPHRDGAAAHGARAHETLTAYVYTTRHTRVLHLHVVRVVRRARAGQLNPDGAQLRQYQGCGTRAPNQRCYGTYSTSIVSERSPSITCCVTRH